MKQTTKISAGRQWLMAVVACTLITCGFSAENTPKTAKSVKSPKPDLVKLLGFEQLTFKDAQGKELLYCQTVEGKDLPGKYSLVLFLHGAGERGDNNRSQLRHGSKPLVDYVRAHKEKAVIIFPQCPAKQQWVNTPWGDPSHVMPEKPSDAMALAMALVDAKIKEFSIDTTRVYATGISMGGYGTWDIIARKPELFAAAMPICGGADTATATRLKDLPLRFFHGDKDGAVPVIRSRNMDAALKKAGSEVYKYTEYPAGGHGIWNKVWQDENNFAWLFAQKKVQK